jgi:nucleoside-diphosphate-sugar epimerase
VAVTGQGSGDEVQDENTPAHPDTDYGKSKLMAEEYLKAFQEKIPCTIIRLPLVYGPRSDRGLCGLFKMAKRGLHIQIAPSSTNVAFVEDVVRGMAMAAINPAAAGQTYIFGEDRIYDSDEIIQSIVRTLGKRSIKIKIPFPLLYGAVGVQETFLDLMRKKPFLRRQSLPAYIGTNYRFSTKKAERELCYKTEYSLERGLRITARWYKDNGYI